MNDTLSLADRLPHASPSSGVHAAAARGEVTLVRGAALLACLDSLAVVAAILAVLVSVNLPAVTGGLDHFLSVRITIKNVLLLGLFAAVWPGVFHLCGLYHADRVRRFRTEAPRLIAAITAGSILTLVFPLTAASSTLTVWHMPYFWLTALGFALLVRGGWRAVDRVRHPHVRRTVIVGTGPLARRIFTDIRADRTRPTEVIGFVDEPYGIDAPAARFQKQTMGTLDELEQILMRQVVDDVVIALPVKSCYGRIQEVIGVCERAGVRALYGTDLFVSTVALPRYDAHGSRAFVAMQVAPDDYRLVVKRVVDVAGATAALLALAPLMILVAIGIKLTSRGPVFFSQERCGLNKRAFRMFKFRSMYSDADTLQESLESRNEANGPNFKIKDDPRITPLGRFLRKSSIDELPQLWNVLRGEMSLVGPRPLPWRDVRRITRPEDMRRFSMRPGLTCLWQVQGRSNIEFERWVELDLDYIDRWSLALDWRILLRTIPAVLSGNGAT